LSKDSIRSQHWTVAKSLSFPLTDPVNSISCNSARLAGQRHRSIKEGEFVTPGGTETADDVDLGDVASLVQRFVTDPIDIRLSTRVLIPDVFAGLRALGRHGARGMAMRHRRVPPIMASTQ